MTLSYTDKVYVRGNRLRSHDWTMAKARGKFFLEMPAYRWSRMVLRQENLFGKSDLVYAAIALSLGFAAWFLSKEATSGISQPKIEKNLEERIYTGRSSDLSGDQTLMKDIDKLLRDKGVKDYTLEKITGDQYIEPVRGHIEIDHYQKILDLVKEDLARLGLKTNYQLKIVRTREDLKPSREETNRIIYLVDALGNAVKASGKPKDYDEKVKSLEFSVDQPRNGEGYMEVYIDEGGDIKVIPGHIFVQTTKITNVNIYSSLYCEMLHEQLLEGATRSVWYLGGRQSIKQNPQSKEVKDAILASQITNEAIVHAIFQHWLEENLGSLGLTKEDLQSEIDFKDKLFMYKGVKVMRNVVKEKGRKALAQHYRVQPLVYWEILKKEVSEYSGIIR